MPTFQRKPEKVEARKLDDQTGAGEIIDWLREGGCEIIKAGCSGNDHMYIEWYSVGEPQRAEEGDWVVRRDDKLYEAMGEATFNNTFVGI